ncbi:MAG: conjugal transfer protein TraB [Halobacteriovoraceae bacterium]|nr:conjugal transfer protein TraB [Halobacteriovoraceae bacterium]
MIYFTLIALILIPEIASASTTGTEFKEFHDFIYNAATGYLGRGIALTGGLIGLGYGAMAGKFITGLVGIGSAIVAVMGPKIIDSFFKSALI